MRLADLIGQTRSAAVLRNAILRDRIAHAYLFCGPEDVGKSTAARLFAQVLNCEDDRARDTAAACGECRSCKLIARGNHPDVRFLTPAAEGESSVIPIKDIRQDLVYDSYLKPVVGRHKIYILDPADRTAHLAIHTILRVLEEPPAYVVTILVTSRPALLPPTIPSRCQQVAFQLAGADDIEQHLLTLGLEPAAASSLARLSGGRVAWAIRAASRPEVLSSRKALLDLCADLPTHGVSAGLRVAEQIKLQALALARAEADAADDEEPADSPRPPSFAGDRALRAELPWCLDVIVSWYRDRVAAAKGGTLLNPDYKTVLDRHAGPRSTLEEERAIEAILQAKRSLQRNANIDLALGSLAVQLLAGAG